MEEIIELKIIGKLDNLRVGLGTLQMLFLAHIDIMRALGHETKRVHWDMNTGDDTYEFYIPYIQVENNER